MLPISSSSFSVHSHTPDFSFSTSPSSGIVFIVPLLTSFLPFHCLQFLSNLPQYSWSYCLSDYPYNIFTVNFPGNSPRLNVVSLCSCHATSSMSLRYSFSNSSITSFAFSKFSLLSQVLDSAINPFQRTRYLSFPLTHRLFRILSTSHFSSPSIMTGAGCSFFCSSTCSMYRHILLIFTTGCIFTVLGSSNLTTFDDIISLTL